MTNSYKRASRLSIVIPVYNEGRNFGNLWQQFRDLIKCPFECYVVYDFDEDNTIAVVQQIIEGGEQRLRLVKNKYGRGVVAAIKSGFSEIEEGPVLVVMADLSDDLSKVDQMLKLYEEGFDLVAASRYMRGGKLVGGPFFKQLLSRLAGLSLHGLRGIPTHDATNAFKLYDKRMLDELNLESTGGFELSLEITVKAFLRGYRIIEIPSVWNDRTEGQSRFKIWSWLPKYFRWYLYAFQPRFQR
jgi:glycosyltransferase involved in cell wall biosynthesis